MKTDFNYLPIDTVFIGRSASEVLTGLLKKDQAGRIAIITGRSVSGTSYFKNLTSLNSSWKVFRNISQHSPIDEIREVANEIRDTGIEYLISVGGGSVIDSAKMIRSMISTEIQQIAIPTTLSSAEFSHIAGYTENGEKRGIREKRLVPKYIILDPDATLETPEILWRSSGIRAMDHAIESSLGSGMIDLRIQFSNISLNKLFANLAGKSREEREECQLASWYSYFDVYDSEMGFSHKIGKIIGARWNIPHGITSCITLPWVLRYYSLTSPVGLSKLSMLVTGRGGKEGIEMLADKIEEFVRDLSLTRKLSDFGISIEDVDYIMQKIDSTDDRLREQIINML